MTLKYLIAIFFSITLNGLIAQNSVGTFNDEKLGIELSLKYINNNSVKITMNGPADAWFAFGFGNNKMEGTYAIVASENGVEERFLEGRNEGELLIESIKIESDAITGEQRKIVLTRSLKAKSAKYFEFSASEKVIDIIYAIGRNSNNERKHKDKGQGQLMFK